MELAKDWDWILPTIHAIFDKDSFEETDNPSRDKLHELDVVLSNKELELKRQEIQNKRGKEL